MFTEAYGTGGATADDEVEWTVTSDGTESNYDGTKGIHYGTSKAQVQYMQLSTSDIIGTITQVKVNASTANNVTATVGVTVGGDAFGGNAQSLSSIATDYTFTGSASGAIVVRLEKPSAANGALYVKSVVVTYTPASAGGLTPEPMQTTYNVTFDGFNEPEMNTTVNVASLPQTFSQIDVYGFYPYMVISGSGSIFTSASVTSGGEGKVGVAINNEKLHITITVSGTFEGTATIHVAGEDYIENPISRDITVSCVVASEPEPAPAVPHTVRFASGNDGWTVTDVDSATSATAPAVLQNVMAGDSLVVTAPATLPGKVKSVKAVKYVPPVLVSSIVLNKQTAYLAKDSTMTLTATVLPENAADKSYTWSSDDITKAYVNQNGVVTGVDGGTANIIATANDGSGVKDTCVVTVLSSVTLEGVTVLYASDNDNWSTVMGYNPGLMYQEYDNVRLTSNGAFLFYDGNPVMVIDFIYPHFYNDYQWLRVAVIHGNEFFYHQGETWQQAISANRPYNQHWSIDNGQVKYNGMQTLVDTNSEPVDPTATIDPSTVDYDLDYIP